MVYTQLSPAALPGRTYSFSPKGEDLRPSDRVTELSAIGLPGPLHSFTAKNPSGGGVKPSDRVTELSAIGLPGKIHSFTAKAAAIEAITYGGRRWVQRGDRLRERILKEDKELMEFIAILVETEMLN